MFPSAEAIVHRLIEGWISTWWAEAIDQSFTETTNGWCLTHNTFSANTGIHLPETSVSLRIQ